MQSGTVLCFYNLMLLLHTFVSLRDGYIQKQQWSRVWFWKINTVINSKRRENYSPKLGRGIGCIKIGGKKSFLIKHFEVTTFISVVIIKEKRKLYLYFTFAHYFVCCLIINANRHSRCHFRETLMKNTCFIQSSSYISHSKSFKLRFLY